MRVLMTVSAWSGHYRSMVPLGWALQAAGHEVRVVCHDSEVDTVRHAGLTPVPLTDGWSVPFQARLLNVLHARQGLWQWPDLPLHPVTGDTVRSLDDFDIAAFRRDNDDQVIETSRRSMDAVVDFARRWRADLVVHDLVSLEGLLAAEVLGIPDAVHPWGPVGTAEEEPGLRFLPVDFSRAFEHYGLPPASFDMVDYFIDPCPTSLAPPTGATRLPVRYVPYNGPGAAPGWVLDTPARPRVCVVWGNSVTRMYGPCSWAVPRLVEALVEFDVEVIVALNRADYAAMNGHADHRDVRLLSNVPVHLFLDSCDLVVHHGGGNSVLNGVSAGIPQLAVTNGLDQHLIGRRLASTGAGLQLLGHELDDAGLREALGTLLGDASFGAAAARLADESRAAPSPAALVRTLEEVAADR